MHSCDHTHGFTSRDAGNRHPYMAMGEKLARASGAPTAILFDNGGSMQHLADDFLGGISSSPYTVLLRGRRVLLASETLEPTDVSILNALRSPS